MEGAGGEGPGRDRSGRTSGHHSERPERPDIVVRVSAVLAASQREGLGGPETQGTELTEGWESGWYYTQGGEVSLQRGSGWEWSFPRCPRPQGSWNGENEGGRRQEAEI